MLDPLKAFDTVNNVKKRLWMFATVEASIHFILVRVPAYCPSQDQTIKTSWNPNGGSARVNQCIYIYRTIPR